MFPNISDGIVLDITVEGSLGIIDVRDGIRRACQSCSNATIADPSICIFVVRQRLVLLSHEIQRESHPLGDGEAFGRRSPDTSVIWGSFQPSPTSPQKLFGGAYMHSENRLANCQSQGLIRTRFVPLRNNSLSVMRARKQGIFGIFEKIDSQYLQQASDTLIHYRRLVGDSRLSFFFFFKMKGGGGVILVSCFSSKVDKHQ